MDVSIDGRISTTDGSHPPPLRWLEIEVHRNGIVSGEGLPVCRASALQSTSTQTALNRCGSALVGKGDFKAQVALGREVGSAGKILAFNSRRKGKPALLLHLFASVPVRFTLVVPLVIEKRAKGQFGTLLKARIPRIGGIVSVTQIGLDHRASLLLQGRAPELRLRRLQRAQISARSALHLCQGQVPLRRPQHRRNEARQELLRPLTSFS